MYVIRSIETDLSAPLTRLTEALPTKGVACVTLLDKLRVKIMAEAKLAEESGKPIGDYMRTCSN